MKDYITICINLTESKQKCDICNNNIKKQENTIKFYKYIDFQTKEELCSHKICIYCWIKSINNNIYNCSICKDEVNKEYEVNNDNIILSNTRNLNTNFVKKYIECCICFEDICLSDFYNKENKVITVLNNCRHIICKSCHTNIINKTNNHHCPICIVPFDKKIDIDGFIKTKTYKHFTTINNSKFEFTKPFKVFNSIIIKRIIYITLFCIIFISIFPIIIILKNLVDKKQ
jgi:hypothetical protein